MATNRELARRRLDERFRAARSGEAPARPHRGWIRAVRDALGMSGRELADRLGVSTQAVSALERSEEREAVQINTLRRAAAALDCDLVYYLSPRTSLEDSVRQQATRRAKARLGPIAHHSKLESQTVSHSDEAAQMEDLIAFFVDRRGLWSLDSEHRV